MLNEIHKLNSEWGYGKGFLKGLMPEVSHRGGVQVSQVKEGRKGGPGRGQCLSLNQHRWWGLTTSSLVILD